MEWYEGGSRDVKGLKPGYERGKTKRIEGERMDSYINDINHRTWGHLESWTLEEMHKTEESIKEAKILGNVKDTPDEQVKVNVLSFSD